MSQQDAQIKISTLKIKLFEKILFLYYFENLKKSSQYIIFAAGEFQYITFIWMATIYSQQISFFESHINFQAFLIYICRIDELINYQFSKQPFYFLIPLLFILLFFIIPIIMLAIVKHKHSILQYTILKIYFKISSIFLQIFVLILVIPFISFSLQSLIFQLNNIDTSIIIVIFVVITLILIFTLTILIFCLCRETIDLESYNFQKLNQTFLDYIIIILQIIQVIIYALLKVGKNAIILQSSIIILLSLIRIFLIFEMNYTEKFKTHLVLLISSFGLVISVYEILDSVNDDIIQLQSNTGALLLYIVLSKSLLEYYQNKEMKIILQIIQIRQIKLLKFYLAKFINNQFTVLEQNLTGGIIKKWLNQLEDETINETTQIINQNINFLQKTNIDYFIIKKLKQYVKSITKKKDYDLHYVALLYKFGLSNLALKQINQFLDTTKTINQNKGFLNESENISAEGSKRITHQSLSSKSMKSNSDDINIIAQKNQIKKNKLYLQGKYQLSSIETSRSLLLKLKIKDIIQTQFYENNKMKSSLSDIQLGVQLFLKNEKRNQGLKNAVTQIINEKLIFLQQFTSKKTIDAGNLYKKAKILTNSISKLEQKLFQRYQEFPSLKIQSVQIFYQAEVLNNYIEASRIKTLTSMPDEQLINMDANVKSTFFSKKVVYMNLTLEDNQSLSIQRKSENAIKFFQIHQDEAKQFTNIEFILPDAIKEIHNLLVQRFIQTSRSKFYLNSCQTFFKISLSFVKTCEFIFDIHFDSMSHYKFSGFFSESSNQSAYILVDINYIIGGMTEALFEMMGFHESQIKQICVLENTKIPIELLLPNFKKLIDSKIQSCITEFRFVKENFVYSDIDKKQTKKQQSLSTTTWTQLEKLLIFEAELLIQYFEIFGYYYYVIEVKELKQNSQTKKSNTQSIKSRNQDGLEHHFDLSDLSEVEAIANSPRAMRNVSKMQNNQTEQQNLEQEQQDNFQIKFQYNDQKLVPDQISFQEQILFSPNTSNIPWQDSSKIPLQQNVRFHQQDYFSKIKDHSISMDDSKNNNLEEINEELERDIPRKKRLTDKIINRKIYEQGEEKQSSSNTELRGIKKSIYFKKYEMINDIVQQINPLTLKLYIGLQELLYLITSIYFIVILLGIQQDLTRFIGEIDMIQLHAGIMNPHDLYLQMRQTIFTYQGFLGAGKITQAQYQNLSNPLYENIAIGYYEFKDGFIQWLSNDYLTPFFKDKNITAWYMKYDATTTYPLTQNIREALLATLSYYYQFKLRFEARLSPANQTYQIYQFANVYNFHYWLEELTLEVLAYSKIRSTQTKDKWNIIWIVFIFLCVCPLMGSIYYYKIFRSKFDKYLNMFKYCNSFKMENEMEKYKTMIKLLSKNPDFIFQYNFNYEQKEDTIVFEKQKNDHDQLRAKDVKLQQQFKNLSFFFGFFCIIIGWLIFLSLSIAANIQIGNYLNKYIPTADTYKLLQDMTLYAGTLYRNRDFGLNFPNLPYLRDYDHEKFYVTMYTGLQTIKTFLEFSYTFDQTQYQVSEDFLNFFLEIQQNDICLTIGDEVLGFLTQYCSKALQGSLKLGLTQTLKFIQNSITTQMVMNNFTKRIEYNVYENEGSLIVMRATQIMSAQFKKGMVDVTHQQITISNTISIIFLIYSIILMGYLYFYLFPNLNQELFLVRKFIQLIPSTVLFLDDQFDRHVRIILASQDY